MSIFNQLEYRKIIRERLDLEKEKDPSRNGAWLASWLRIRPPYLSKVLNGRAHFDTDQLYLCSEALNFKDKERNFLFLLLEYERSGIHERKNNLLAKIKSIQQEELSTEASIKTETPKISTTDLAQYYLDPLNLIIHMSLTLENVDCRPEKLAGLLKLPLKTVQNSLNTLEKLGIIRWDENKYKILVKGMHLPANSPLCRPHQLLLRQLTSQHFHHGQNEKDYDLAITFSADEATRKKIKSLFLAFLKEADHFIEKAPSKGVYQLNFDLFSWS